jgi:hypothetical protein
MTEFASPVHEPFVILAQDILRRAYAGDDAHGLSQWIITQAGKLGGTVPENAIMSWERSFDFFDEEMEKRRRLAALPESERHEMRWAWASWNRVIDPFEPGMLAVISAGDGQGENSRSRNTSRVVGKAGL